MRLGLHLSPQHLEGGDPARWLAEHLELVALARELGLDTVLVPQHFLPSPYRMLQPIPLLARLAPEAGRMRIGTGILLLSLLNPVEAAETLATLDVISGGRLVVGVGRGYRPEEFAAFGAERGSRAFAARLDVLRALLEGETVTAEAPGFRLEGAQIGVRPLQRPRPPIWMAANGDAAVRDAARRADAWLVNPHASVDEIARQLDLYRAARAGTAGELPVVREVCLAETDREAHALAETHLGDKYRAYVRWGQSEVMAPSDTLRRDWSDLLRGRFLVGSPETAAGELRALRDRLGATLLLARVQWPGLPHRHALRSLRLLAEAWSGPGPGAPAA